MSVNGTMLEGKYPAKAHCRRVAQYLIDAGFSRHGVIYLEAQKTHMVEDDDQAMHFRQRRYFFYLSGCKLPDAYLTYNIPQDILTLFIPPIDPDSVIWSGLPESQEEAMAKYDVDNVLYSNEVNAALAAYGPSRAATVYAIPEQVSEHITFLPFKAVEFSCLKTAIDECRVVKDSYEVALIRKANEISTLGHIEAAKAVRTATNEQELYGAFVGTCISNGAHELAYHSICASGTSCSTLHYVRNDQPLRDRLNILLDAGAEYGCYCADITRTFPISGTFTPESQTIYNIVDEMQSSCFKMLRANMRWEDVHMNAHRVAIRGLKSAGIFVGDEEEIFNKRISVAFMPHGLGHYLGMDTHDTGGHANYDDPDQMFKYLRVRGPVPAGAVITVEPGIYFCNFILDPVLEDPELSRYIDKSVLERYWAVGGVRIEDDVHILEDGYENLTKTPKW
ncbi:xaa-Pro dipeptidase [Cladophialophora psammophila CBS 110553]|uniref:Probable Xaa-Pro aminopeptidase PEPP n=1 Tax=Cladophialophora psammophila CBS 110553 TaxID=1182543 RepID=W9WR37_9EURO|nr:xaa-Pro dipeptidase [Cladophialophora psammophila CBS 110553]EXJ67141.1 xaa-Pro dipeptidase [Cladophialophora psammophila CBS 110553]